MIISVLNTKGGVGKSTVAINLAVAWAAEGYDSLLIDTDEDGTSLAWYGRREDTSKKLTVVALPDSQALKKSIKPLLEKHDVIIIDGAPHLREMLIASAWISNLVIIPVKPSPNDIWKLEPMLERLKEVTEIRKEGNRPGPVICFLVNENNDRTRLSKEVTEALSGYDLKVLETRLGARVDYRDSFNQGLAALEFSNVKAISEIYSLFSEVKSILDVN